MGCRCIPRQALLIVHVHALLSRKVRKGQQLKYRQDDSANDFFEYNDIQN